MVMTAGSAQGPHHPSQAPPTPTRSLHSGGLPSDPIAERGPSVGVGGVGKGGGGLAPIPFAPSLLIQAVLPARGTNGQATSLFLACHANG
jgi:hypothetical protein